MSAIYFSPLPCTQVKVYVFFLLQYYIYVYIINALLFVKSFFFFFVEQLYKHACVHVWFFKESH